MDNVVNAKRSRAKASDAAAEGKPSRDEAEAAVRTLIRWAGDDPDREGLRSTPSRVVRAYEEWFAGYNDDPREYLKRTFEETGGYDELIVLSNVRVVMHWCVPSATTATPWGFKTASRQAAISAVIFSWICSRRA